ncbi:bifunctional folylpolyglutamate synthase/dihydrofolate synthase [Collinsella vaginalis]|uniref:bifunctional folylpolyglutamate synthase/dihydrofolate synthase n=1 Tax=Collinsella vaginalis TaxID=1870987 RepID=UPI000A272988|nr:Mur ligase family protein [Collinsella vaginalis]
MKQSPIYTVPFDVPELPFEEAVSIAADTGVISGDAGPLLETVVEMLDELERPDAHMDCIQVAGTNGKSSTTRFAAAILAGEGRRCALYTSPQLVRYPERMEVGGHPVSDAAFAHGVSAASEAGRRVNERRAAAGETAYAITPFDLLTVAALVIFAEAAVDVAVLEVGLGGRWDATSATNPVAVAITGIGLDHMRILGDTLAEIAGEKAAVIKPGRAVVLGEGTHEPSVAAVMEERCRAAGVTPITAAHEVLRLPHHLGDELRVRVRGVHADYEVGIAKPAYQGQNLACAILLAEAYLGRALSADRLQASLAACPTPGRFDVLRREPLLLVDACHNPQSCENFVASLDEIAPDRARRPTLLIAALTDKDVAGIVRVLAPAFPAFAVTQTASARALPADDLARLLRDELAAEGRADAEVTVFDSVAAALDASAESGSPLVAAGTITLAGEVAGLVRRSEGTDAKK